MLSTAVCRVLALLLPISGAFPVYEVTGGSPLEVNAQHSFNSLARLSDTRAIQCYADYSTGEGVGNCNVLTLSGETVEAGNMVVFNSMETLEVSVVGFSDTQVLVCYWDGANLKRLTCKSLTISGTDVIVGDAFVVNAAAAVETTYAVASLSAGIGVVCWSYTGNLGLYKHGAGVCNKLALDGEGVITQGADYFFDEDHTSQGFSIQPVTTDSALLCWSAEGAGTCTVLTLSSGDDSFAQLGNAVFYQSAAAYYEGLVVASLTSTEGVVCYADGVDSNALQCKLLTVEGSNLTAASEAVVVNSDPTSWVAATTLTESEGETAMLVCYATEEGGNVNANEFKGMGTCNIVGMAAETGELGAGPANVVNELPTEHTALATLGSHSAMLCYSGFGAGQGQCRALGMAPTTTTSTASSTTSATETTTSTASSTSPHSTTATTITTTTNTSPTVTTTTITATITATSTATSITTTSPHTVTMTETTTSPHTTTITSGTERTVDMESSGSISSACVNAAAALAVVLSAVA
jgi:hypothetical protein